MLLVILRSESTVLQEEKKPDQQTCSDVTEISLAWTLTSNFVTLISNFVLNIYIDYISSKCVLGHVV